MCTPSFTFVKKKKIGIISTVPPETVDPTPRFSLGNAVAGYFFDVVKLQSGHKVATEKLASVNKMLQ